MMIDFDQINEYLQMDCKFLETNLLTEPQDWNENNGKTSRRTFNKDSDYIQSEKLNKKN